MDKENENFGKSENTESLGENASTQGERDFQLNKISCPSCGGVVDITEDQEFAICPFCRHQLSVVKESLDLTIDRGVLMKYNGESREVEVPPGVRAISNTAFFQQNTLTKIILPEGLNELQGGFYGCSSLETVILPDTIENFPPSVFQGCISLKSVVLPKYLKNLGMNAFYDCLKLTSIEIPPMVKTIEAGIFMNCESLETIFCYENTKFGKDYNFIGCDSLVSINVLDSKTGETISTKRIVDAEYGNSKVIEEDSGVENDSNAVEDAGNTKKSLKLSDFFRKG
ncbi:MAG: leucine-rich repeat protein [Methanobrevibacter sp.]|nr:leucine-rich repeat protein [Methanobrevibacter sp.]